MFISFILYNQLFITALLSHLILVFLNHGKWFVFLFWNHRKRLNHIVLDFKHGFVFILLVLYHGDRFKPVLRNLKAWFLTIILNHWNGFSLVVYLSKLIVIIFNLRFLYVIVKIVILLLSLWHCNLFIIILINFLFRLIKLKVFYVLFLWFF